MDSAKPDSINGNGDTRDLAAHKQGLRAAGRAVDPLKPLREHPFITVGAAAMLGATLASPGLGNWLQTTASSIIIQAVKALEEELKKNHPTPTPPEVSAAQEPVEAK